MIFCFSDLSWFGQEQWLVRIYVSINFRFCYIVSTYSAFILWKQANKWNWLLTCLSWLKSNALITKLWLNRFIFNLLSLTEEIRKGGELAGGLDISWGSYWPGPGNDGYLGWSWTLSQPSLSPEYTGYCSTLPNLPCLAWP